MTLTSGTKLGPYEVIKKLADIATAYVTGEAGYGKVHRPSPLPDTRQGCTTRFQFVRVTWQAGSNPPGRKLVLPTLDADNWRNQGSSA
jgi:hypothetical protein